MERHNWTTGDLEYLDNAYPNPTIDSKFIAMVLDVSLGALQKKAYERGLRRHSGEIKTRRCSKCKDVLPIACFHKNKRASGGRSYLCKRCESERNKEYRERKK